MREYRITTQKQLRAEFWANFPDLPRRKGSQNDQLPVTRVMWVHWLDWLQKDNQISPELADRATL